MLRLTTLAITQGSSFDNDIEITGVQAMFSTCMKIHFKDYTVLQLAENPFQLWCIQMLWKIISNTLLVLGTTCKKINQFISISWQSINILEASFNVFTTSSRLILKMFRPSIPCNFSTPSVKRRSHGELAVSLLFLPVPWCLLQQPAV